MIAKKKIILPLLVIILVILAITMLTIPNNKLGEPTFSKYYQGNYKKVFNELLPAAQNGDSVAQVSLGNLYRRGLGIKQDYKKAYYWYKMAADQNNPDALGSIGLMYKNGIFFKKNDKKAIQYYNKALKIDSSNSTTKYNLALIYLNGPTEINNIPKGLKLLNESVQENNSIAESEMGISYYLGLHNLPIKYKEAFRLTKKSAFQGDPMGQNNLALLYYEGKAIKKNDFIQHGYMDILKNRNSLLKLIHSI
jgi:uncharacterized protein